MSEDDYIWSLDPILYKVISLYDFQIPIFIVILTNEFGTSTVQIPSIAIVRLHPSDDVFILSNYDEKFIQLLILWSHYLVLLEILLLLFLYS